MIEESELNPVLGTHAVSKILERPNERTKWILLFGIRKEMKNNYLDVFHYGFVSRFLGRSG